MTNKFFTRIALALFVTLTGAFAIVEGVSLMNGRTGDHTAQTATPTKDLPKVGVIIRAPDAPLPAASVAPISQPPAPGQVTITDLKQLASDVHLTNPKSNENKQEWKLAIDKAQTLVSQPCDCEQKYWLNQFVEAGNQALSGSTDYAATIKQLETLPKNDDEAATHQISSL
jgi:hypothetical protein